MRAGSWLPPRLLGCLLLAACLGGCLGAPPAPAPVQGGVAASCPQNWRLFRGYCYGFFQEKLTWDEAEAECERYGPKGHLASIHSQGTSRVLAAYLESQSHATDHIWIGLHDEEHSRQWKWTDDSVYDFKKWDVGQPNNMWDKEDCVVLYHLSGFKLWHDYPCDRKFSFLCQNQL
ncbi:C-type lectin Cal-like [Pezoporus wallicus]|uniref:C-type lectin Cal-like n=1 Tax=Pezoporus wallicus TaxID=35540 RepID=UPI00254E6C3D|nr:C-type lectin Cal-like [Pezoporus wallicus]